MDAKSRKVLKIAAGWEALELILRFIFIGAWQIIKITFKRLWKGHRRKPSSDMSTIQLTVDSSVGTHCYIKVMGVKYHYVETGPKNGELVIVLGDAPEPSASWGPGWGRVVTQLIHSGRRVISLDLRGVGGSEGGGRRDLAPPRALEELLVLTNALGVSESNPAILIGQGVGGMLTWYFVHVHGALVSRFVVIGAPHPNLYWQYPPTSYSRDILHFIQWPIFPERWLAESQSSTKAEGAHLRARDWTGALNYIRGAAWWRIRKGCRAEPPALLVGPREGNGAAQMVASAEYCASPTLRLVTRAHAAEPELLPVIEEFLIREDGSAIASVESSRGLMGRVFGAVAGRGRELTAVVSRARLVLPTPA